MSNKLIDIDGLKKFKTLLEEEIPSNLSNLSDDATHRVVTDIEKAYWNAKLDSADLSKYVEKEEGKSLIANTEIARLATVTNYDDTALSNRVKAVEDTYVPKVDGKGLSTNDFTNDLKETLENCDEDLDVLMGDITEEGSILKTVNDAITTAISGITQFDYQVVTDLPATGKKGVIYLVANGQSTASNIYDEYIWTGATYELIGNTQVDISNKADKATTLAGYGITDAYTKTDIVEVTADEVLAEWNKIFV